MHHGEYDAPMTTTKPRITITLEPATAARLRRVSDLTGNSQSSIVSEVLDQAGDVFDRLIQVLEAAETAKARVSRSSVEKLEEAQRKVEESLGIALDDFRRATEPFIEAAEEDGLAGGTALAGGPASDVGVLPTPLSNRGVRSTTDVRKKTTKRAPNA